MQMAAERDFPMALFSKSVTTNVKEISNISRYNILF